MFELLFIFALVWAAGDFTQLVREEKRREREDQQFWEAYRKRCNREPQ
jgi:hypothetical protein